jgi:hypothetical protein
MGDIKKLFGGKAAQAVRASLHTKSEITRREKPWQFVVAQANE